MEKELSVEFTRNPFIIWVKYDQEIIWTHYYEHPIDFIHDLDKMIKMNDKEIYDTCIFDKKNNDLIKKGE